MLDMMAPRLLLGALGALPLAHAHMQMSNPSPFRDPHANRQNEPKDYNILQPLRADGSDFACKGYQWNTPWTTVATYEAGGTYKMQLQGTATHGGGSCQLSMSFDGGMEFKVIKSIEGGCPNTKEYNFTVPPELGNGGKKTGLFAWTWFNKIGNREMYMNCAVVDIVPKGSRGKKERDEMPEHIDKRDVQRANVQAQAALSSYPELFVANLKSVNDCVTKETQDIIFDSPGKSVQFADGQGSAKSPSFTGKKCTGKGSKNAGSSSPPSSPGQWTTPSPSSGSSSQSSSPGQWTPPSPSSQDHSTTKDHGTSNCNDGQWHPECYGGSSSQKSLGGSVASARAQAKLQVEDVETGEAPSPQVEKQLDAYLKSLYGNSRRLRRATCADTNASTGGCTSPGRWIKKGECEWACERQGTRVLKRSSWTSTPSSKEMEANLKSLGTNITKMVQLLIAKQTAKGASAKDIDASLSKLNTNINRLVEACGRGTTSKQTKSNLAAFKSSLRILVQGIALQKPSRHRRQEPTPAQATQSPASTFDLFLAYLSRLQTTVIECIRSFAAVSGAAVATTPTPTPLPPTHIPKRQLVVPSMSLTDWIKAQNLPKDIESDPVFTGLRDLGLNWDQLYDSLRPKAPPAPAPPRKSNVAQSTPPPKETVNALEQAANEAGFKAALAADTLQNSPPTKHNATHQTPNLNPNHGPPTTTSPHIDPALLPLLLGPGPVIPSGVALNWPSSETQVPSLDVGNLEHFPVVVDDLGPGAEEDVKKFFEGLGKGDGDGAGRVKEGV